GAMRAWNIPSKATNTMLSGDSFERAAKYSYPSRLRCAAMYLPASVITAVTLGFFQRTACSRDSRSRSRVSGGGGPECAQLAATAATIAVANIDRVMMSSLRVSADFRRHLWVLEMPGRWSGGKVQVVGL